MELYKPCKLNLQYFKYAKLYNKGEKIICLASHQLCLNIQS